MRTVDGGLASLSQSPFRTAADLILLSILTILHYFQQHVHLQKKHYFSEWIETDVTFLFDTKHLNILYGNVCMQLTSYIRTHCLLYKFRWLNEVYNEL